MSPSLKYIPPSFVSVVILTLTHPELLLKKMVFLLRGKWRGREREREMKKEREGDTERGREGKPSFYGRTLQILVAGPGPQPGSGSTVQVPSMGTRNPSTCAMLLASQ